MVTLEYFTARTLARGIGPRDSWYPDRYTNTVPSEYMFKLLLLTNVIDQKISHMRAISNYGSERNDAQEPRCYRIPLWIAYMCVCVLMRTTSNVNSPASLNIPSHFTFLHFPLCARKRRRVLNISEYSLHLPRFHVRFSCFPTVRATLR
jgi:hypothetical protein